MNKEQEDWETPPKPEGVSVRAGEQVRRLWAHNKTRELMEYGMAPESRRAAMEGSQRMAQLLTRPEGFVYAVEVADVLDMASGQIRESTKSALKPLGSGYSLKIPGGPPHGTRSRIYSRQAACMMAMSAKGDTAASVRAWMAEIVSRAVVHPDFQDLISLRD